MDYKNFATGLTVDHDDIKQNAALCGIDDGVWKCLLIQQENTKNGMIIPEDEWRGFNFQIPGGSLDISRLQQNAPKSRPSISFWPHFSTCFSVFHILINYNNEKRDCDDKEKTFCA